MAKQISVKKSEKRVYDPKKPFNAQIRELIRATHLDGGEISITPLGKRFEIHEHPPFWADALKMDAVDGIGTGGWIHWQMNTIEAGVQNAFAMVVDDLMEHAKIPYIMRDHLEVQEEDRDKILRAVKELVRLAIAHPWKGRSGERPIIISGGETAVKNKIKGFEIGIFGTGYSRSNFAFGLDPIAGDSLIGLGSSGIHSNGIMPFSEAFEKQGKSIHTELPWGKTIGEEITMPTYIYMDALKELIGELTVEEHGLEMNEAVRKMVHVTGGGQSKFGEFLKEVNNFQKKRKDIDVYVRRDHKLNPQKIFFYAAEEFAIPCREMYETFNNGVGYAIIVNKGEEYRALNILRKHFPAEIIGEVRRGTGKVRIESQYDSETIVF